MNPSSGSAFASAGGPCKNPHDQQQQHVEVMHQSQDYHVLVDARSEAGRRPSVEVVLRPDPSTSLRGELLMEQEDVEFTPTPRAGLVKCLQTDFDAAAAAAGAPAIEPARPIDGTANISDRKEDSLIDRTIDLQRHMSRVRSEISLDFDLSTMANQLHQRGWLTSSSRQEQGTFDSEDNSFLFNSPRGVTKLAPFFPPRSTTPNNLTDSTGMSCGVLSTAFKSSPMICTSAKAVARNKYASAADTHAKSISGASQERTASLSDSQMTPELRLVSIAGLDS